MFEGVTEPPSYGLGKKEHNFGEVIEIELEGILPIVEKSEIQESWSKWSGEKIRNYGN